MGRGPRLGVLRPPSLIAYLRSKDIELATIFSPYTTTTKNVALLVRTKKLYKTLLYQ